MKSETAGVPIGEQHLMLEQPMSAKLLYRSRAGLREAGALVSVLCLVVGGTVTLVDMMDSDGQPGLATAYALGTTVPGLIAGVVLLSIGDAASVEVTPVLGPR